MKGILSSLTGPSFGPERAKMKLLLATRTLEVPNDVEIEVKGRAVRVKVICFFLRSPRRRQGVSRASDSAAAA